jgi:hypothetical protein
MKLHSVQFSLSSVISSISLPLFLSLTPPDLLLCTVYRETGRYKEVECCYMMCCRSRSSATNTTQKPLLTLRKIFNA